MIERIVDLTTEPVVGRFYLVPTVRGVYVGYKYDWPVMTPLHEDADIIGFPWQHYHLDPRFFPTRYYDAIDEFSIRGGIERELASKPLSIGKEVGTNLSLGPVVERKRKCLRVMQYRSIFRERIGEWPGKLEHAYSDATLKPGMICPHRGVCLKSMPVRNGVVQCPAHGLHWRTEDGAMVPAKYVLGETT